MSENMRPMTPYEKRMRFGKTMTDVSLDKNNAKFHNDVKKINESAAEQRNFNNISTTYANNKRFSVERREKINFIKENLQDQLIRDFLFEPFYESLVLDKEYKERYKNALREYFSIEFDKIGGIKYLQSIRSKNSIVNNIFEATAMIVSNKIDKEGEKDDVNTVSTDCKSIFMDKEDLKLIDMERRDLDLEAVSGIIQNKVKNVMKREIELSKKEQEDISTIRDEIQSMYQDTDKTPEEIEEAFVAAIHRRKVLKENSIISTSMQRLTKEAEKNLKEGETLNMDEIMADAILEYTIMEFFHTMNIYSVDRGEVIAKNVMSTKRMISESINK